MPVTFLCLRAARAHSAVRLRSETLFQASFLVRDVNTIILQLSDCRISKILLYAVRGLVYWGHRKKYHGSARSTFQHGYSSVISGFLHDADEICALLAYNAASSGNPVPTFRDNIPIRCPETSVKNYHSTLRYIPEGRRCHGYISTQGYFLMFPSTRLAIPTLVCIHDRTVYRRRQHVKNERPVYCTEVGIMKRM
jgi:hypothetical protein